MITFSLKRSDGISERAYMMEIFQLLQKNMPYIKGLDIYFADEISSRVLRHAIAHRNKDKEGTLNAYIRSLASSFNKEIHAEINAVDYLDDPNSYCANTLYDTLAWVTHEVAYDITGCNTVAEKLMLQYLLTPAHVVAYCIDVLSAVKINNILVAEEEAAYETQNIDSWDVTLKTIRRYSESTVLQGLLKAAQYIAQQQRAQQHYVKSSYKDVPIINIQYNLLSTITEKPTIALTDKHGNGKLYVIDKYSLKMRDLEGKNTICMDFTNWEPIDGNGSFRATYAIDISAIMEYLAARVAVDYGVNTKYIRWLRDRNVKYLPSGTALIDCTYEQYMNEVKAEILTSLLSAGIIDIIGLSDDFIYIRPMRRPQYKDIKITLFNGKTFRVSITMVQREKRKK